MNIGEITVKVKKDLTDEGKEFIRLIVQEEMAAQREQPVTIEINNCTIKGHLSDSLLKTLMM